MGSVQSSHADSNNNVYPSDGKPLLESVRGRKSFASEAPHGLRESIVSEPSIPFVSTFVADVDLTVTEVDVEDDDEESVISVEEDSDDEFEQEEDLDEDEREMILLETRNLKQLAQFFLHPEHPVQADGTAMARCYFDRPSAPLPVLEEDEEERMRIMDDMQALKKKARDFDHPELPVQTVDATIFGRNYFSRPSAPVNDEEDDRAFVLADMLKLKKFAVDFRHPEHPVLSDSTARARNFFTRPSAPEQDMEDHVEVREEILHDIAVLKEAASHYMHPELPVATDGFSCGRNYFSRPSSSEQDSSEDAEERSRIIDDIDHLKRLAIDFAHPERPVEADCILFGRNYFLRVSAAEQDDEVDMDERELVLAECKALKKLSVDFLHPELPVVADAELFGRNYFSRPSAMEEEDQDADVCRLIMSDCIRLKKLAVDYQHPELSVEVDGTACGRNYFTRVSAPLLEDEDFDEEREQIVADCSALKKLTVDYMHPELPVETDGTAFGRNYFSRPFADEQEAATHDTQRGLVMADCGKLKKLAIDYQHPEVPVKMDAASFGRNYFMRPSAASPELDENAEELAGILEDGTVLKKLAAYYYHPENKVTTDAVASGRNYFNRPSAPGHDHMIQTFPGHDDSDYHDYHDEHHHEHLDHFGLDEELDGMFEDMRGRLHVPAGGDYPDKHDVNEEEGKLSRSPSSVMLFTEESIYD